MGLGHICLGIWRSEEALQDCLSTSTTWVLRAELRSSGLLAIAVTHCAVLPDCRYLFL